MKAGDQLEVIGPKPAVLREGADKASAKLGALQPGGSHEVVSLARTASGATRVELAELGRTRKSSVRRPATRRPVCATGSRGSRRCASSW